MTVKFKTAKALGLIISPSILSRADEAAIALDVVMDPKSNYRNETRERRAEVQLDAARAFSAKMKATLDEVRARKS